MIKLVSEYFIIGDKRILSAESRINKEGNILFYQEYEKGKTQSIKTFSYDENQNVICECEENPDGKTEVRFNYDVSGNLLNQFQYFNGELTEEIQLNYSEKGFERKTYFDGELCETCISEIHDDFTTILSFYNDSGKLIQKQKILNKEYTDETFYYDERDILTGSQTTKKDEHGNILEVRYFNEKGMCTEFELFWYENNLLTRKHTLNLFSYMEETFTTYVYENEKLVIEEIKDSSDRMLYQVRMNYDENGELEELFGFAVPGFEHLERKLKMYGAFHYLYETKWLTNSEINPH